MRFPTCCVVRWSPSGNFDGVHRGHQELVARARAMADVRGRAVGSPHLQPASACLPFPRTGPSSVSPPQRERVGGDAPPGARRRHHSPLRRGSSPPRRPGRFWSASSGTRSLRAVSWSGHDFHFGKGREGTPETMRGFCEAHGLGCEIVPVVEENRCGDLLQRHSRRTRRRRYREGQPASRLSLVRYPPRSATARNAVGTWVTPRPTWHWRKAVPCATVSMRCA